MDTSASAAPSGELVMRQDKENTRTRVVEILAATANGCLSELGYFPGMPLKFQQAVQMTTQLQTENTKLYEDNCQLQAKNTKLFEDNHKLAKVVAAQSERLSSLLRPEPGDTQPSKQLLQELAEKVRVLTADREALARRNASREESYQKLAGEFRQLQWTHQAVWNELMYLRQLNKQGQPSSSGNGAVVIQRPAAGGGLPTPTDMVPGEVLGWQPMIGGHEQYRRRASEGLPQELQQRRVSDGLPHSAGPSTSRAMPFSTTRGDGPSPSPPPRNIVSTAAHPPHSSMLGPIPPDAIPIASNIAPVPPRPKRPAASTSTAEVEMYVHSSSAPPLVPSQQPQATIFEGEMGSIPSQPPQPTIQAIPVPSQVSHFSPPVDHGLPLADRGRRPLLAPLQTETRILSPDVALVDSPLAVKEESTEEHPKRKSEDLEEARKRPRLEGVTTPTPPPTASVEAPQTEEAEVEQEEEEEEEEEEEDPLQNVVDSTFDEDEENENELTCGLCRCRFENGMSEAPKKFVQASLDELVAHLREEHPAPFERLLEMQQKQT